MSKLVVVVGPTASGKSDLAMTLAREFNGEIICADSRTVYQGMDIGTAKPSRQDQQEIPHHLLDVVAPNEEFSVGKFQKLARRSIKDISSRGKLPILVGGSGLYIDSILFDYRFPGEGVVDPLLRQELEDSDLDTLVERLKRVDPDALQRVALGNRRRVMRAIELAGKSTSRSQTLRPETLVIGMAMNKEVIQFRIESRAKIMLQDGVIMEAEKLAKHYSWELESMTGPAYRAARACVEGGGDASTWLTANLRGEMALVKKQMTWFRRNPYIQWIEDPEQALGMVRGFLS